MLTSLLGLAGTIGYDECRSGMSQAPDNFDSTVSCSVDRATNITVDIIVALAILYFAVTYALLLYKLRGYRRLPYTFVQVGIVYNTLQVSTASNPGNCWLVSLRTHVISSTCIMMLCSDVRLVIAYIQVHLCTMQITLCC